MQKRSTWKPRSIIFHALTTKDVQDYRWILQTQGPNNSPLSEQETFPGEVEITAEGQQAKVCPVAQFSPLWTENTTGISSWVIFSWPWTVTGLLLVSKYQSKKRVWLIQFCSPLSDVRGSCLSQDIRLKKHHKTSRVPTYKYGFGSIYRGLILSVALINSKDYILRSQEPMLWTQLEESSAAAPVMRFTRQCSYATRGHTFQCKGSSASIQEFPV